MKKPEEVLQLFQKYNPLVEQEIKRLLDEQPRFLMYDMMRYFFGFLDDDLKPADIYAGKRYRSGLCLLIADLYGKKDQALEVATAVEIFHNFTLIHDDIEDNDPLRRGRETVWKKWGINHGINTGDAQLILADMEKTRAIAKYPQAGLAAKKFLDECFLKVIEGQYLDFTLTDLPPGDDFVNQDNYLEMISKKTSVLVGAATKVAGIMAEVAEAEQERLWQYGLNFGLAYQLCDDLVSVWGDKEMTGKIEANDLYEKKKTLPVLHLLATATAEQKIILLEIYNRPERLTAEAVAEVKKMLAESDAYDYVWQKIETYKTQALTAVVGLSLDESAKAVLKNVMEALLPDVKRGG